MRAWILCALAAPLFAQPAEEPKRLPVQRVVLYKNGVGYFEHVGKVKDNEEVTIRFTSGQLDDALKSITLLDLNGGRISAVNYGTSAPLDRQFGELRLNPGEKASLQELLGALRGAKLEVKSGTNVITGRLLSVERKTRMNGGTTLEVDYVSLVTETGEVKTTEVSPGFAVKLLERDIAGQVSKYLDLLGASRAADERLMRIRTAGTGERRLLVSYISEVPVWKATYRIVLPSKPNEKPLLQGWAIIDNTVGQDWENVKLSLVAGAPQSFVQKLSQPLYARRPEVSFRGEAALTPQTFQSATNPNGAALWGIVTDASGGVVPNASVVVYDSLGQVAGRATTGPSGLYSFPALPDGPARLQVQASGFRTAHLNNIAINSNASQQSNVRLDVGSVSEAVEVNADAAVLNTSASMVRGNASRNVGGNNALGGGGALGKGGAGDRRWFSAPGAVAGSMAETLQSSTSSAQAQDLGDLFEYQLKEPVTIRRSQSALVPIANTPIEVEKVSVWNSQSPSPRPVRSLWLNNTSGLTLDGGAFSVLEQETFAGEGIFDPIRAGEKRLISYASDLAVTASQKPSGGPEQITRCRVAKGLLVHEFETRDERTYSFRNEDSAARTILVEHPARAGYELRSAVKPVETTPRLLRFRVAVAPKSTANLEVTEVRPNKVEYHISNLTPEQIQVFVSRRSISPEIETALRGILAQKERIKSFESQAEATEAKMAAIYDDQQRLRENIKALRGSAEEKALLVRYTRQLDEQENQLAELRKAKERSEKQQEAEEEKLDKMIAALTFDIRL